MAPPFDREPSRVARAREALLVWFLEKGPRYPWRDLEDDAFAVLVSEVMLQQTQAARVARAFTGFLRRFPSVDALASASRADVVRAWGGLGHNRRAVALHETARAILRDHGGVVPRDLRTLLALPGIGPYTAAAVASIAFDVPVPAIDTNARKVMARLALGVEPDEAAEGVIAEAAGEWLAREAPGEWNQAVMTLGREVCRPVPRCQRCPLAAECRFRESGRVTRRRAARGQEPFEGSMRQVRGGVVRELRSRRRAATLGELAEALAEPLDRVEQAVLALERDSLVERTRAGRVRLPR